MNNIVYNRIKHNEVSRKYRANNLEKVRETARNYVKRKMESNLEEFREKSRKNALAHYYRHYDKVRGKDNERKRLYRLKNNEEYLAKQREYRKNNPDKFKQYYLKKKENIKIYSRKRTIEKYGITEEQYNQILMLQKGKCALCDKDFGDVRPQIDHCHKTGKVRGLLCFQCNPSLGFFEKVLERNPNILESITKYLKTHSN